MNKEPTNVFGDNPDGEKPKKHQTGKIKGFDRGAWDKDRRIPQPNEHFKPGLVVKDGLCKIIKNSGGGGACDVYLVSIENYWEALKLQLLQGDIEQLWDYTGITAEDAIENPEPTPVQIKTVDDIIEKYKETYKGKFPQELMGYIPEKMRSGTAILKVLRPEKSEGQGDSNDIKRIQQEASVMKHDLNHENIIQVFHYFVADGYHCILEESFEGARGLDTVLKEREITKEEAANIGRALSKAVKHSHTKNILWRDLKPANVLVNDEGVIKAIDWGIAKKIRSQGIRALLEDTTTKGDLSITDKNLIAATPNYASPEQMTNPKAAGKPTDLFSLGSTLYEIVTRKKAFIGDTYPAIAQKIISPDPEDIPAFPNEIIKEQRENEINERQLSGVDTNAPLPSYVSEDFEDLVMMLVEKEEVKRIREDYLEELWDNIHNNKIYEKKEVSPEEAAKRDKEITNLLSRANHEEEQLEKTQGTEKIKKLLQVAADYTNIANLIPRIAKEGMLPNFSREDAFVKAIEFYTEVLENQSPLSPDMKIDRDEIENIIHRLACNYRVEFNRADQQRLLKKGEKIAKEKPQGWAGKIFSSGTSYSLSKLESAYMFLEKGMFVAAKKEWKDADDYSKEEKVSANAYQQLKRFEDDLENAKNKVNFENSVERGIYTIKKLIQLRRFDDASEAIAGTYGLAEQKRSERSAEFVQEIEKLDNLNNDSETEHSKFQEIARAVGVEKDHYKALKSELKQNIIFPRSVLEEAAQTTEELWKEYQSIDKVLAGESQCAELKKVFDDLMPTNQMLRVNLSKTCFLNVNQQVITLSNINPQIDKYDPNVMETISQTQAIIDAINGETGINTIEIGEGYIPQEIFKPLKDKFKAEQERFRMVVEPVNYFKELEAKAEKGIDPEKIDACRKLALTYMVERGDIDKALEYFENMPKAARDKDDSTEMHAETGPMIVMFEAYKRVKDESKFIRKIEGGLDDKVISHLKFARTEQIGKIFVKDDRNDFSFDTELLLVCSYLKQDPKAIINLRESIDNNYANLNRAKTEVQAIQNQPEQYKAKQDEILGLDAHIKQQAGNYASAIGAIIEVAEKMVEAEGTIQPEDKRDYITIATYLRDLSKEYKSAKTAKITIDFYKKYMDLIPEESKEANAVKQNIAHIMPIMEKP